MNSLDFLYYLAMCFGFSFLIGVERQFRRRIIGLRTTILVSVGAFLFVSFSFLVGSSDMSRIASQVVTGIGFLGAGVILKDGKRIRGLTTAATLWCDAAIGVLCAGGAILPAAIGTFIILFSNTILRYVNKLIYTITDDKETRTFYVLSVKCLKKDTLEIKKVITNYITLQKETEINNLNIRDNNESSHITIKYVVYGKNKHLNELSDQLYEKYKISSFELKKIEENKTIDLDEES